MKTSRFYLVSTALLLGITPVCRSAEALPPLLVKEATAEEGLLTLSRAYNNDIFADATAIDGAAKDTHDFQPEDPRNKFPVRTRFISWAQDHKLSMLQSESTLLFWAEPNIENLWQEMRNGSGLHPELPLPTSGKLRSILQSFLRAEPQNTAKLTTPFHLNDVSPELSKYLAAVAVEKIANPSHDDYQVHYFIDSFWQKSRLTYNPPQPVPSNVTINNKKVTINPDPMWPFCLQTLIEDEHPRVFIEFNPFLGTLKKGATETLIEGESLNKTPQGTMHVRVVELDSQLENSPDWRLTETTIVKPNSQTQRVMETRPSLGDEATPWQKVVDNEKIRQALKAMGEDGLPTGFGERSLKALKEFNGKANVAPLPPAEVLEKLITFEVRRQPLPEVLKELSTQSGTKLTTVGIAPDTSAKILLTARVQAKPLRQVMQNLTRLYGIEWSSPQAGSYIANVPERSNWRVKLLQFGDFQYYRCRNMWNEEHNQRVQNIREWGKMVWQKFGKDAVTAPNTVPFTELPTEVQQGIRREAESSARYILMQQQIRAVERLRGDLTFQLDSQLRQLGIFIDGKLHSVVRLGVPLNKMTMPVANIKNNAPK